MKVYDCFTYNGERDILKLHLNILAPYVDRFIIVEANQTFTGHPKELHFFREQRYFKQFWGKIDYFVVNNWEDETLWEKARTSPNTKGAFHWQREFYIKENIHKALRSSGVQDNDMVFIGDVDEIIDPAALYESDSPIKARLKVYQYYLNNESSEEFWGTLIAQYGQIKDSCLNHLRSDPTLYSKGDPIGWHFTSQGGFKELQRKLDDSYTAETYNSPIIQAALKQNYENRLDFLGRNFTFKITEDSWPSYLKEHKKEYKHLLTRQ